jgi:response regulator NasT
MNTSLRIAVADHEPEMRRFLYRVLTYEGHEVVVVAETGRQLIHECMREHPDLVITDYTMPDIDGIEAIHAITNAEIVPAILVSGRSSREILARAARELVFAFLVKPIKMDDLQPAISMTMQRFSEVRALLRRRNDISSATEGVSL